MNSSAIFNKCRFQALPNQDLMPWDCMDILLENYGENRMGNMKPTTIYTMVKNLMQLVESDPDKQEIIDTVNAWLNS